MSLNMNIHTICCICLESNCDYIMICCKNKIHKECMINWFIYKGIFNCPLCRNSNIRISTKELLNTSIKNYGLNKDDLSSNLRNLIQINKLDNHIVINITDNNNNINDIYTYNYNWLRYRILLNIKQCIILLFVPIFYILLFFLINKHHNIKYVEYI